MNIVYIVSDGVNEFNSSNFRTAVPSDALRNAGHKISILNFRHWLSQSDECRRACARADIIHLQRVLTEESYQYIDKWRGFKKAVVADWDDSYDRILPDNAAADFWLHGKVSIATTFGMVYSKELDRHPIEQFRTGLSRCTAGITPSKILSKDWEIYTPTFVVPNYVDQELYFRARKYNNGDRILLGWGGSLSHTQSWRDSGIEQALRRVLSERENVYLYIVGDDRIVKQLPIRRDKIIFSPYTPWWLWQETLKKFDIGLAPLAGAYDDRRSALKVTEYVVAGLPFVASRSPVYEQLWDVDSGLFVKHDGHPLEERTEDWYKSTIDAIDNLTYYRQRADHNVLTIGTEWFASENVNNIINVYEKIIALER